LYSFSSLFPRVETYFRSREVGKKGTGRGKQTGVGVKVKALEVRAIRIAKLDRAVQEGRSTDIPASNPAL
jgi:hypothetical protein